MYFKADAISTNPGLELECGQTLPQPTGRHCNTAAKYIVEMGAGPHKVKVALCEKCMREAEEQASRWEDI